MSTKNERRSLSILLLLVVGLLSWGCGDETSLGGGCGDGVASLDEICDGTDLHGSTCQILGYAGGTLGCASDCYAFDTAQCTEVPICGDGFAESLELCDGVDFRGETCESFGLPAGRLSCDPSCASIDTSACGGGEEVSCGNGVGEGIEACDGVDLRGQTCETFGFNRGTLSCRADCSLDSSDCFSGVALCGDSVAEGSEACDGDDLRGETCVSQGFEGGTLSCVASCLRFVTDACTAGEVCGDGVAEGLELCDGADLKGATCVSEGFANGTLACGPNCDSLVTTSCTNIAAICGDDVAQGEEICDGTDLRGQSCTTVAGGFTGGALGCSPYCGAYVTTGCTTGSTTVPTGWICDPTYYGDLECDCGCGALDMDCADGTDASCSFDNCALGESVDPAQNWLCTGGSSSGWTCDPTWFGDLDCDCGCGAIDSDCYDGTDSACVYNNCPGTDVPDASQNWLCVSGTSSNWTCDPTYFGDLDCDCGCGALDSDCYDGSDSSCYYNNCPTGEVPDASQNWLCVGGTSSTWTCDLAWFGDGGCDCGCGSLDSDCYDGTDASCDFNECPAGANPLPNQNWLCSGGGGGGWTCNASYLGDGDCDCGCGTQDSDCPSSSDLDCAYEWCPAGLAPAPNENWLCI